ncbi:hypothetical protein FH972_022355 [Carpinus fangiana]|uniref:tRNA 4-demethylwyosine synthase (AdoMet-dependent) n=1 Tax=Carpinus fangiana TaxID=176857 RepID=A0A5N6KS08_9ROSI|nr:hypothetical protein FH972_022355 [Carpinus fangiana]
MTVWEAPPGAVRSSGRHVHSMETVLQLWHDYRIPAGLLVGLVLLLWRLAGTRRGKSSENPEAVRERALDIPEVFKQPTKQTPRDPEKPVRHIASTQAAVAIGPRKIKGQKTTRRPSPQRRQDTPLQVQPLVFFSSLGGSTEKYAGDLLKTLPSALTTAAPSASNIRAPQLLDLSYIEYEDYFTGLPKSDESIAYVYLILLPTYNIDTNLSNFLEHLQETHYDFRVDTASLSGILGYSVFGFGDREGWPTEAEGFCSQAKEVDKWMAKLTARRRAYPLGMGDVKSDLKQRLGEWQSGIVDVIIDLAAGGSLGEGVPGSGNAVESDEEDDELDGQSRKPPDLADLETLGGNMDSEEPLAVDFTTYGRMQSSKPAQPAPSAPKEMVPKTSPTYAALTKQGYTIVGSHSGVKICRWTKSALRGRGSCYKFSFYGIKSHLCMETTPSLSCSNKCVFCWRHGTNPVGTTWRWQVDQPDVIFNGVKAGHYKKIKMMRGVPGVRAERFEEAMRIRHCALSLVGEPIFYPYINEFTGMLHAERISSFLVCNAQHPDQLATLKPVTQLYVSIDASNKESLRKIDRPLHRDFWERFCRCLDILKEKRFRQRTVFRLTLVKGFNIDDEAEGYADLVERGLPCLVEVKGVTYCGTSSSAGAGLTMQNVPFYEEVCAFVKALNAALERRGLKYGIAAEHAHSCCILLAATERFFVGGKWHTVIDYERFFERLESGDPFAPEDYMAPTPEWALWGNGGFDPADQRVDRKGRPKVVEI